MSPHLSYLARAANHSNPTAKRLLELMDRKRSNLCLSADVTTCAQVLDLADRLGPQICMLKTHVDIIEDFDLAFVERLKDLAHRHDFLIFEDRKFADIGSTVKLQYSAGVHRIASWSDLTNAHPVPGEGVVWGLKEVGEPLGRALLLLAEMSSAGSLATGAYTAETLKMAQRNRGFVIGFIGQRRLDAEEDFLYLTPGVGLVAKGDALGQQYRTPREVILDSGCDVIIVGRGIYADPARAVEVAGEYRMAGWDAYLERIGGSK